MLGRYMYGETLGRWRTADLLIGLAYLAQRESEEHPCADIAEHGRMLGLGLSTADRAALAVHSAPHLLLDHIKVCVMWNIHLPSEEAIRQAGGTVKNGQTTFSACSIAAPLM